MNSQHDKLNGEEPNRPEAEAEATERPTVRRKRPFVEPTVTPPVDLRQAIVSFMAPTIETASTGS
jgi:hypothetical protein